MVHPSHADAQAVEAQYERLESAVELDEQRIQRDETLYALDRLERAHDRCVALAQAHGAKLTAPPAEWHAAHEQLVAAKAAWWVEVQNFRTIVALAICQAPVVHEVGHE